jgi:hypothetical protein
MTRHATAEDLARLDLDGLKPRKAAKVRAHVASCVQCTQLAGQVSAIPTMLASVPYPSMPPSVAVQLDAALAREGVRRLASAPATEAGRRDLPARHARKARVGWQLPGMSVFATRLVAAAGALIIAGAGGYEIAAHTSGNGTGTTASSTGSAALPSAGHLTFGPAVHYGQRSAAQTVQTVHADTNFTSSDLGAQATAAVREAKLEGATGARSGGVKAPAPAGGSANSAVTGPPAAATGLASCLDAVVGSQPVQLVETAKFEGKPATIIVTAPTAGHPAEVWAVGPACSASHPDVLAHQTLSHT